MIKTTTPKMPRLPRKWLLKIHMQSLMMNLLCLLILIPSALTLDLQSVDLSKYGKFIRVRAFFPMLPLEHIFEQFQSQFDIIFLAFEVFLLNYFFLT